MRDAEKEKERKEMAKLLMETKHEDLVSQVGKINQEMAEETTKKAKGVAGLMGMVPEEEMTISIKVLGDRDDEESKVWIKTKDYAGIDSIGKTYKEFEEKDKAMERLLMHDDASEIVKIWDRKRKEKNVEIEKYLLETIIEINEGGRKDKVYGLPMTSILVAGSVWEDWKEMYKHIKKEFLTLENVELEERERYVNIKVDENIKVWKVKHIGSGNITEIVWVCIDRGWDEKLDKLFNQGSIGTVKMRFDDIVELGGLPKDIKSKISELRKQVEEHQTFVVQPKVEEMVCSVAKVEDVIPFYFDDSELSRKYEDERTQEEIDKDNELKERYDELVKEHTYKIGDWVCVSGSGINPNKKWTNQKWSIIKQDEFDKYITHSEVVSYRYKEFGSNDFDTILHIKERLKND